jgi:hypothetical protein
MGTKIMDERHADSAEIAPVTGAREARRVPRGNDAASSFTPRPNPPDPREPDPVSLLLDDRVDPPLRVRIGELLASTTTADFAISRMRLDGLDLGGGELGRIQRCRVLLGRLDARTLEVLMGGNQSGTARPHHLRGLRDLLISGRVEVRAAGVVAWNPDFSIFGGLHGSPASAVALVGAHYFMRPFPIDGVALTMMITAPAPIRHLQRRFDELWEEGYDVGEVVRTTLEHLEEELDRSGRTPILG